jgi:hypothetical protein
MNAALLVIFGVFLGAVAVPTRPAIPPGANPQEEHMLRSVKSAMFGGKKRRVASVVAVLALVASGSAFAAWMIFSGVTGSGGAKADTASTVGAITLTPNYQSGDALLSPGSSGDVMVDLRNADTSKNVSIQTLTAASVTSDKGAGCVTTGITFTPDPAAIGGGNSYGPNATRTHIRIGTLSAASLPAGCSGAVFTVNLTGTTSAF